MRNGRVFSKFKCVERASGQTATSEQRQRNAVAATNTDTTATSGSAQGAGNVSLQELAKYISNETQAAANLRIKQAVDAGFTIDEVAQAQAESYKATQNSDADTVKFAAQTKAAYIGNDFIRPTVAQVQAVTENGKPAFTESESQMLAGNRMGLSEPIWDKAVTELRKKYESITGKPALTGANNGETKEALAVPVTGSAGIRATDSVGALDGNEGQVNASPTNNPNAAVPASVTPTISTGNSVSNPSAQPDAGGGAAVATSAAAVQSAKEADLAPSKLSFTTSNKEKVTGARLTNALNKVANDLVRNFEGQRREPYASHVTEKQKDDTLKKNIAYAKEVREGKHLGNLGISQRVNVELTGETIAILPKTQSTSSQKQVTEPASTPKQGKEADLAPQGKEVSRDIGAAKEGRSEANAKQTARDLAKRNLAIDYTVEADDTLKNGFVVVGREKSKSTVNPTDFVRSPDGGVDFGEITPEISKAILRQAGKIRLQQGLQNADGTGYGLAHIEANHGKQIRNAGFNTVQDFVSQVAKNFTKILNPIGMQLLVAVTNGRKDVMFVQLSPDASGDFYRINTAFPTSRDYLEKQEAKGSKVLWDGSEPTPTATGKQPLYADKPEKITSSSAPIAQGQSDASVAQTPNNLVRTKSISGKYYYIKQSDIDSSKDRLRIYTKDGKSNGFIVRENLDPTGEKQDERNARNPDNPLLKIIGTKDGVAFKSKIAAARELNIRRLQNSYEIVDAGDVQAGAVGFVLRRKSVSGDARGISSSQGSGTSGGVGTSVSAKALTTDKAAKFTADQLWNELKDLAKPFTGLRLSQIEKQGLSTSKLRSILDDVKEFVKEQEGDYFRYPFLVDEMESLIAQLQDEIKQTVPTNYKNSDSKPLFSQSPTTTNPSNPTAIRKAIEGIFSGMKDAWARVSKHTEIINSADVADLIKAKPYLKAVQNSITAYHGSPYRFSEFSLEHLGRGEGAQAYGWGLYFADSKDVADWYGSTLSSALKIKLADGNLVAESTYPNNSIEKIAIGRVFNQIGKNQNADIAKAFKDVIVNARRSTGENSDIRARENAIASFLEKNLSGQLSIVKNTGQLYRVNIKPDEDTFLLWDKPLSEQPKKVKDALVSYTPNLQEYIDAGFSQAEAKLEFEKAKRNFDATLASTFYAGENRTTRSEKERSIEFQKLGINGIKYLDGTSRDSGKGSYNYVVFDDKAVEIVEAYYSRGDDAKVQAFYDPTDKKIYLIADRIEQGTEASVWLHEVFHKRGEELLGKDNLKKLYDNVQGWKTRKPDSVERQIYEAANARASASTTGIMPETQAKLRKEVGESEGAFYETTGRRFDELTNSEAGFILRDVGKFRANLVARGNGQSNGNNAESLQRTSCDAKNII